MLAFLAGCVENQIETKDGPGTVQTTPAPPTPPTASLAAAPAFDPLRAPLEVEAQGPPGVDVVVTATGDLGAVWQITGTTDETGAFSTAWDGRSSDGTWAPSGSYELEADFAWEPALSAIAPTASVRVGFVGASLEGDGGVTATRAPVYWPVDRVVVGDGEPVAALDGDDGPLDFPAVADGVMARRPAGNEPVAFAYDSRPVLTLTPAETWDQGSTGLSSVDVSVAVDGWTVLSGAPLRDGVPVVLQLDDPLGTALGVSDLDLDLEFSAGGEVLGHQRLPLRIWRVEGPSAFEDTGDAYRAWAPVLEEAMPALEGVDPDPNAVVSALVEHVFSDLGLRYDTSSGSSAYSDYAGFDFGRPHFLLTDFLLRRFGSVINCSDAANILGAWTNMVGVPLDHVILEPGFDLNYIEAIGTTSFTHCPFGPGGCGFSYHAVTSIPGTNLVWDATLALDGDGDPSSSPSTALMPEALTSDDYLYRLVMAGSPTYNDESQETLQ